MFFSFEAFDAKVSFLLKISKKEELQLFSCNKADLETKGVEPDFGLVSIDPFKSRSSTSRSTGKNTFLTVKKRASLTRRLMLTSQPLSRRVEPSSAMGKNTMWCKTHLAATSTATTAIIITRSFVCHWPLFETKESENPLLSPEFSSSICRVFRNNTDGIVNETI